MNRRQRKAYTVAVRYEIRATVLDLDESGQVDPTSYPRMTDERLAIEDTFDLADAVSLTAVLRKIDQVHSVLRPEATS